MFAVADKKRIQVPTDKPLRDFLIDLSARLSKERDEDIGVGSLIAILLDPLVDRPDLLQQLLEEAGGTVDSQAAKPSNRKKASGRKAA